MVRQWVHADAEARSWRHWCRGAVTLAGKRAAEGAWRQGQAPGSLAGQIIKGFTEEVIFRLGIEAFGIFSAEDAQ